jgi:hypothetical protein
VSEPGAIVAFQIIILFLVLCLGWAVHLILASRNAVPYVTAPPKVLPEILAALDLPAKGELWDLGCGDGRVLEAAHRMQPRLKLRGVENNPMPLQLARMKLRGAADLRQGEILDANLKQANRVYCYLGPGLMRDLEPKFFAELPKGARVVSMQFRMPGRKPDAEIVLNHGRAYAAKLYVYDY